MLISRFFFFSFGSQEKIPKAVVVWSVSGGEVNTVVSNETIVKDLEISALVQFSSTKR